MEDMQNKRGRKPKEKFSIFSQRLSSLIFSSYKNLNTIAEEIGITRQSLAQYRDGKNIPDVMTLAKIADYFNVSADYLLGRTKAKSTDVEIQSICNCIGISGKAAENLRKAAYGYWKPLNSVLENERFWKLLEIIESYNAAFSNYDNFGEYVRGTVNAAARALLPDPQHDDIDEMNKSIFQSVFSRYISKIAEDYYLDCSRKDGDTNGKHKQENE